MPKVLTEEQIDEVIEDLIAYQHKRVVELARRINPRLTHDDVWNPIDFPELQTHAEWNYEDGILAGYRSAQMAIRSRYRKGP